MAWDSASGTSVTVAAADAPIISSIGGGWLVWATPTGLSGVLLEDVVAR
jgi:hypothetical protein